MEMNTNNLISPSRNYCGLKEEVIKFINQVRSILYPDIFRPVGAKGVTKEATEMAARDTFTRIIENFIPEEEKRTDVMEKLKDKLPEIYETLSTDILAAYEGDPAAMSYDEIMLSYPSFEAMSIFRVAHELYNLEVPIVPRMLTEYAHKNTGIDIHPGAKIGSHFFIDHGTGVVIGETAEIGDHVKIYQGVTIGAKSFKTDDEGNIIKGIKRHPNIGNNVVIYAGATILGGETTIGDNCIIGGNTWVTESIKPNQIVMAAHNEITQRTLND
jgi:serine O-acetyltransferase